MHEQKKKQKTVRELLKTKAYPDEPDTVQTKHSLITI